MKLSENELNTIVKGCIAGNRKDQQQLFKCFFGKMMVVCMRYTRDRDTAQDILQDGFIKAFEKMADFTFTGSFEGWLRRIMVNTAIDQLRKNKRDPFAIEDDHRIQNIEEEIPFSDEDSEDIKIKAEVAIKAISKLSPAYRTVFNMYVVEGFTHKEIAEYLGISEGTSKSNLAKAKLKLKTELLVKFEQD